MASLPDTFDSATSILFLGSGFSREARNIRGGHLPIGQELKVEFAKLLGVAAEDYDLKTLADEVASREDLNLYQNIYELFTISSLSEPQRDILSMPWRRIYTTNYDDAAEFFCHSNKSNVKSYSYDDEKPRKIGNGAIVHLHGVVRKANSQNVLEQLILNESSYVRQHFEKSLWYDEFARDIRFSTATYFVGYSLSDYHITSLLLQNPATSAKTYFITKVDPDKIFLNRVSAYGTVLPIATEGFATACKTHPRPCSTPEIARLASFRYLDPFKDKKTLIPPTSIEILHLVTYGSFNYQRCMSALPAPNYVIPRQAKAEEAVELLRNHHTLLIHSWLGNGKTLFLYILTHKLSERGFKCFWCNGQSPSLQQDIHALKATLNTIILFDSYNIAIDIIQELHNQLPLAKFIVAVRTGVQDVRLHEIQDKLPKPISRLTLNGITTDDANNFKVLLDRSGVRMPNLEMVIDSCKDFREVVVSLYDNADIRKKLESDLRPLLSEPDSKIVFIVSHLLKWAGEDIDAGFIRSVTSKDAYIAMAKFREIAGDVFKFSEGDLQVRSAIFSEYMIQNHFSPDDIVECTYLVLVEAVRRKRERRYQRITSHLMQISNLRSLLKNDSQCKERLVGLFDRLRRDIEVNQEPLFWLQYTILMIEANDLMAAEKFLETAYARAANRHGFKTYQIDTQSLRLLLLIEGADTSPNVARFDEIVKKIELVLSMITEESHRVYAIRVLQNIEPFVSSRVSDMSIAEKSALVFHFNRIIDALGRLPIDIRVQDGSDDVKSSVIRAKQRLMR